MTFTAFPIPTITVQQWGLPYNIKDFGAVGNGTSDDTAAIQAALDTIATAGGGCVYFPPGTYFVTAALLIPSLCKIQGAGWSSVVKINNTLAPTNMTGIPHLVSAFTYTVFTNANFAAGNNDIIIESISLDCSQAPVTGSVHPIFFYQVTRTRMNQIKVLGDGAGVQSCIAHLNSSYYTVTNCHATNFMNCAYDNWHGSHDFQIIGNFGQAASPSPSFGILASGVVSDGTVSAPVYNIVIADNILLDCPAVAIWLQGGLTASGVSNAKVANNICINTVAVPFGGIRASESTRVSITGNIIRGTNTYAINTGREVTFGLSEGVIADNMISGITGAFAAIYVDTASEKIQVSDNEIGAGAHTYGIHVEFGANTILLTDNLITVGSLGRILNNGTSSIYHDTDPVGFKHTLVGNVTVDGGVALIRSGQPVFLGDTTNTNLFALTHDAVQTLSVAYNGGPAAMRISAIGALYAALSIQTGIVAVASLPAAAVGNRGTRLLVIDSSVDLTAGIGLVVAGGGASTVPVWSDGANWRIG